MGIPAEVGSRFAPFLEMPDQATIISDFDGTLSAIVADPKTARPLPGVVQVLADLSRRFATVAVVSGRPASFLVAQLGDIDGLRLAGSYGAEWAGTNGMITSDPSFDRWRPVVAEIVARLRTVVPAGVFVEDKELSLTLHWRRAPEAEQWAVDTATAESERSGLVRHAGRQAVELRPPVPIDKGSAVEQLADGSVAVCYLGDDVGDLAAFTALDRLATQDGTTVVKVAVTEDECSPEVAAAADLIVDGPSGALRLLRWLADAS